MKSKTNEWGVRLVLCLPLCIALAWIYSGFLPRLYYSRTIIEVPPLWNRPLNKDPDALGLYRVLQSKEVLSPVIDELGLAGKRPVAGPTPARQQVYARLVNMVHIQTHPIRQDKGVVSL